MNKKIIPTVVLTVSFLFGGMSVMAETSAVGVEPVALQVTLVSTDTITGDVDPTQTSTCLLLTSDNLRYKAKDATTNGEVTDLQDFLVSMSFLKTQSTGYFGLSTFNAVKQFQKKSGLNPTGYVGPLTKTKIKEISCSGNFSSSNEGGQGSDRGEQGKKIIDILGRPIMASSTMKACTMEARMCPDGRMMARDVGSCKWLEDSCGKPNFGSSTLPSRDIKKQEDGPRMMSGMGATTEARPSRETHEEQRKYVCEKQKLVCGSASSASSYNNMAACKELTVMCDKLSAGTPDTRVPQDTMMPPSYDTTSSKAMKVCTMEARLCANGTMMPRDASCGWHPEKCGDMKQETMMR